MKLLLVATYFYPKLGGMEKYAFNIAKGLQTKYKWEVIVVTSNHIKNEFNIENIEGIKIYQLPYWFKLSNTPLSLFWYHTIKQIINNEKPDLINAHTPVPFIADVVSSVKGKIPLVVTYHTGSMIKGKLIPDIIIGIYERFFLRILLNRAKRIIYVSRFVRDSLLKDVIGKSHLISPGVDLNLFKPIKKKKNIIFQILTIGGLRKAESYKRLEDIFYAVKELINQDKIVNLVSVGEGDNLDYFKDLSKKLNIQRYVTFKGQLDKEELVRQYQVSNALVLASINESFGMVLIESMACGTPVIGAKNGGIKEVISDGKDGLLYTPKNVSELTKAISKLISNKTLRAEMGKQGHVKVVKDYGWDKKIENTNKLFIDTVR